MKTSHVKGAFDPRACVVACPARGLRGKLQPRCAPAGRVQSCEACPPVGILAPHYEPLLDVQFPGRFGNFHWFAPDTHAQS